MIRINLLPSEYRRSERTSPKIFAATLTGVIAVCSAFGWFGFVYLGELGNLEVEEAAVAEDLTSKKKQALYHDALQTEKKEFETRSQTIKSIADSRIVWTEVLDQLVDVVNNDGDTERHFAWLRNIQVKGSNDAKKGPSIQAPGMVQGESYKKVADFHEDLENSPFAVNVMSKSTPGGQKEIDKSRIPEEAISFSLKLDFKPAPKWQRSSADAQPAK